MTILLIRHGETALNAARVLQPADTPLSERGRAQARAVGARLAAMGVAAVLSSDLPRALQTAQAIAAACGGAPLHLSALLQERNFGDLRGKPYDGLGFDPLTMADAPPGGESLAALVERARQALAQAAALRATLDGPLAVVSHGLVIRTLLALHVPLPPGVVPPARIGNTALSVLGAQPPHAATQVNCTAHLAGLQGDDGRSLSGG